MTHERQAPHAVRAADVAVRSRPLLRPGQGEVRPRRAARLGAATSPRASARRTRASSTTSARATVGRSSACSATSRTSTCEPSSRTRASCTRPLDDSQATSQRSNADAGTSGTRTPHDSRDASQKARKRAENTATPQRHPHDEPPTEQPLSTREGTTRRGPIRCCAPDQPCISLTFRNERELRDHLSNVHWLDDTQIETALRPRLTVIEGATA
jgi:hypothetical protein